MVTAANDSSSAPEVEALFQKAYQTNGWFRPENIRLALNQWSQALTPDKLQQWLQDYTLPSMQPKNIGLILAGNIPFVGLHDLLCIWASGHSAIVKCASKDPYLLPWLVKELENICPEKKGCIQFTKDALSNYEAIIATGSNNSARYFETYFSKVPHLIRKNRNGVAVVDGTETKEQLEGLGADILTYYGLGCRNVSKVYLPKGYDLDLIFGGLYPYRDIIENQKYANNYDYNKAVFLMSEFDFLENGFFMIRESSEWAAPIACLHYETYDNLDTLQTELALQKEHIQCIVSECDIPNAFPLGKAQHPQLWDYADGVDTLAFLSEL